MGDRLLRMQDDVETMQRLMNELEFEKKQYEQEIEKELQLIAELECKTEAGKQEVKLNRDAAKQRDEEAKLLSNQSVQNMHNYSSLQEACDILSEQEKSLLGRLKEVKTAGQAAREKHKATVDHYEDIYKSYKEKYEKYPLAIERKQKEEELATWEKNYNDAKLKAQEAEKKLMWMETTASQKAGASEFPIFKNQKEFIIRLAEMKITFDELVAEFKRKTHCCEELKKFIEEAKARRQMEEKKKEDEEKRIAEEGRVSEERSIAEKRVEAEMQRQEERRRHSEEKMEERQMEETRQRTLFQQIPLQLPLQKDGFRLEMNRTPRPAALPASAAFHQRLPPKILMPTRQLSFQQKPDRESGVFLPPLPPTKLQHRVTATGKRLRYVETSVPIKTPVPCSEATMTITAGVIQRQHTYPVAPAAVTTTIPPKQPLYIETPVATPTSVSSKQPLCFETPVATRTPVPPKQPLFIETPVAITTPVPPKQPLCFETPVATTTPMQFNQPSVPEAPVRFTVLPKQVPCPEAAGAITTCLKNLSIFGQTDENTLMETEDETQQSEFDFLPAEPNSVAHSGFYQQSGGVAAGPHEDLVSSSAKVQEAEEEIRKENRLDTVGTETPTMSTDQHDQDASLEVTASSAGLVYPKTSLNLSHIMSSCQPLQTITAVDSSCGDSVMLSDPVGPSSDQSRLNADCLVSSSLNLSVSFPSDISVSPGLSCNLVSEASLSAASLDCPTSTLASSFKCPAAVTPSAVNVNCPTSEEIAVTPQVCNANSVVSAAYLDCTTTTVSTSKSAESAATDFSESIEQPSGWTICGAKTPVVPAAEGADSGKFIGSSSPITEFSFEEEMAKLKRLSESPAINLYAGRRMFVQSDRLEDKPAPVRETGGTSSFMCDFGQFESAQQTKKDSEKATFPDFGFGNLFTFSGRSDSNQLFSFFGSRANETENSSKREKDAATASDDIFKMFGGSDAENAVSRKKEARVDESGDIFKMLGISGNTSANSCKNNSDDAGGFFNFGVKPLDDGPVKSQFKFF